jgi:hypothetical protein
MARREFASTAAGMKFPFFTVGHSMRPIGEFIDLLTASEIGIVVTEHLSRFFTRRYLRILRALRGRQFTRKLRSL